MEKLISIIISIIFVAIDFALFVWSVNSIYGCYVALGIWGLSALIHTPAAVTIGGRNFFLTICKCILAINAYTFITRHPSNLFTITYVVLFVELILYIAESIRGNKA